MHVHRAGSLLPLWKSPHRNRLQQIPELRQAIARHPKAQERRLNPGSVVVIDLPQTLPWAHEARPAQAKNDLLRTTANRSVRPAP